MYSNVTLRKKERLLSDDIRSKELPFLSFLQSFKRKDAIQLSRHYWRNIQSDRKLMQLKVSCLPIRSELCLCVNTLEMLNFKMFTILRATCIISCRRISIKVSTKPWQCTTCSKYVDLHWSNQNKTIKFFWKKITFKVTNTEVKYYIVVFDSMLQE